MNVREIRLSYYSFMLSTGLAILGTLFISSLLASCEVALSLGAQCCVSYLGGCTTSLRDSTPQLCQPLMLDRLGEEESVTGCRELKKRIP